MNGRELSQFAKQLYTLHQWDVEPATFVHQLLRSGVVGIPIPVESPLYIKVRFEYLMSDLLPDVRHDLDYCVHPVMGDLFRMRPPDNGKAIYPLSELDRWMEEAASI